ncbi:E3 ubiquitin-protein ligase SIAH1B-like isoform X1 [Phlebotomus papatasi]|uniref:E3 ubiquitin-protein ligase SIAH1B-like isoform X1 n=1 Tax=Phlebotomus papatasi TaxID=29031 RepID=UPI0024840DE0|nr:E3 ubiquitin-protein ligase SIAH1B-like isoform X1 [Phlebotomus papatasi]
MGSVESTLPNSPVNRASGASSSLADRVFCCPVCYEKYTSNIMMCQKGHAVCQKCYPHLEQCPLCCARYLGTRNFILEEIISELNRLNTCPEDAVKYILDAATLRDSAAAASSSQAAKVSSPGVRQGNNTQTAVREEKTVCRMQYCRISLLAKDLRGHLIEKHKENVFQLRASSYLSKSYFNFDLTCTGGNRRALLTEFGIFFLIIRVEKLNRLNPKDLIVTAWVQGTCTNNEAPLFYSWLQVNVRHIKATYHDYVHGSRSTVSQIEEKNECLNFAVRAEPYSTLKIQGYVCLNKNYSERPRRTETETEYCSNDNVSSSSTDDGYY